MFVLSPDFDSFARLPERRKRVVMIGWRGGGERLKVAHQAES